MMPQELEDYNTAEATAEYLKFDTVEQLKRLARAHKIDHIKTGRSYVFPRTAIEQWVEDNTKKRDKPDNPFGLTDRALRNHRR